MVDVNVKYTGVEDINLNINQELAYTIIFSISNFMVGCSTLKLDIKVHQKDEEVLVEYKLTNFKFKLDEIEKYITQKNNDTEFMSIGLIEKIINKIEGVEYQKKDNSIILSLTKYKIISEPISKVLN